MNGPDRAAFWMEFLLSRANYPAPDRLRAQLRGAESSEFCECGCNSFAVTVRSDVPLLAPSGGRYGSIYEADFMMNDGRTLEIILFADESGNLAFVEVDCCGNSYPVPDIIEAEATPFHTNANECLIT